MQYQKEYLEMLAEAAKPSYTQEAIANVLKKNKYIEVPYNKIDDVAAKDEVFGETIGAIGAGKSDRIFYKKLSGDTVAFVVKKNGTVGDPSNTNWGKDIGEFFAYYNIKP